MNLIQDPWIPVATRSGRRFRIAPWQLTERIAHDPIVMVAAPRPDFSGALLEFLIGLLQTKAAPEERRGWTRWKEHPPAPEELRERLGRAAPYFELFGDGPRFMQSLDDFEGKEKSIADLIVDTPPSEMINKNTDLFIKRGSVRGLCPACAAAALYAANTYSPAAGRGHRTSLRGGGPVTTVVAADPGLQPERATLWHSVWFNVMPRRVFEQWIPGNTVLGDPSRIYPWLAPTRTSENGEVTTPEDMSPYHVFWGMPRRIRLDPPGEADARCSVCDNRERLVGSYLLRHGGMNYEGAWVHPLTPYAYDEAGVPAAFHMPRGGLGYRNWPAMVTGRQERKIRREPAATVRNALEMARGPVRRTAVVAFGYDVDNAKIRGWYDHRVPAYGLDPQAMGALRELATAMVSAAEEVAGNLRTALKVAWTMPKSSKSSKPSKSSKSPNFAVSAVSAFWRDTEPRFLESLDRLVEALGREDAERQVLKDWHRVLCDVSENLFVTWAEAGEIGAVDPGRVARAHLQLKRFNTGKTIRDALLLPEKPKSGKGARS